MSSLRERIDQLIQADDARGATRALALYWTEQGPTPATASFLNSRFEALRGKLSLTPYRVAILRSFTVEPVIPLVRALGFLAGLDVAVHVSEFNAYAQEILDEGSSLYAFAPDAVFLAVETRAAAPELWFGKDAENAAERVLADVRQWIGYFRRRCQAHLIVHTFEQPELPGGGLIETQCDGGSRPGVEMLNRELRRLVREFTGVWVLDYDALVARYGRRAWHDERKWLTVRLPMTSQALPELAKEWVRFLHPLSGKIAKAVVLDLDNTLWGGVIGEDGMSGIQLGVEYPGAAYQALQRALLSLKERGILLAIASKNNVEDAMEVLENHPGMLLRPRDFTAMQIHWGDKAASLTAIAEELNIGTDSLAFLDDNPVEREQVGAALPEVHVVDLPADPMEYARAVLECPLFERLALSDEDRKRGEYYQAQRERSDLERRVGNKEDFYRALDQKLEVSRVNRATLARVAQLTQKTNQFNLTTRRYTEAQIAALAASPGCSVFTLRVRDRFADNGLVAVAILKCAGECAEIDTFLMSCRVIGRSVETALLSYLVSEAESAGAARVEGWFLPTKKNAPARDFYERHGFTMVQDTGKGTLWAWDRSHGALTCPGWIQMIKVEGDGSASL